MEITKRKLSTDQFQALLDVEESHFVDLKSADITRQAS